MIISEAREEDKDTDCEGARRVKDSRSRAGQRHHPGHQQSKRESISSASTRHPGTNLPIKTTPLPPSSTPLPTSLPSRPSHNKTLPTAPPPLALTAVTSISINIPSSINPATTIVAAGLASPNASRSSANTGSPKSLRSGRM